MPDGVCIVQHSSISVKLMNVHTKIDMGAYLMILEECLGEVIVLEVSISFLLELFRDFYLLGRCLMDRF